MPIGVVGKEGGQAVYGRTFREDPGLLKLSAEKAAYKLASERDSLTGALSRFGLERYWSVTLPRLVQREVVKRQVPFPEIPVALFLGDVIKFKRYNKLFGHAGGDAALVKIFQTATRMIRPSDGLARPMGDEIVIVLPGISPRRATELKKKLRMEAEPKIRLDFAFVSPGLKIHDVLGRIETTKKEGRRGKKLKLAELLAGL